MKTPAVWVRVNRSHPCKVCGKPDWCRVAADGSTAHCCRVESDHPWPGPAGGWLHKLSGEALPPPPKRPKPLRLTPRIDWTAEALRCLQKGDPAADAARRALADSLWVSVASLEALGVGIWWDAQKEVTCSTWPCLNAVGAVVGIALRYPDATKRYRKGSSPGLFYAPSCWLTSSVDRHGPIYIPEGGSDTAVLLELGLAAVGRPTNQTAPFLADFLAKHGTKRPIVVLAERDWRLVDSGPPHDPLCLGCSRCWPGFFGAGTVAGELRRVLNRPIQVCFIGEYKDVRDWRRQNVLASAKSFEAQVTRDF